ESRRRRSYLASNISEKISAMAVVQAHGQRKRELRHLRRQSTRLKNAMIRRAARVGGLRALSEGTVRLATACALLVGAVEVGAGQASAGTVVAAMSVVAFLAAPLRDLSRVYEYWQAARVSREKLAGFLSRPDVVRDPRHPAQLRPGPGRLEFLDVSVAGSLDGFTAVVRPGQVTAVIGPNGAGKSTLVWLIARLLEPESGEILLDGQPLRSLRVDTLRRAVGLVSLDVPLLKGSVEKNLRYRGGQVSDTEFARICQLCGVDEVLADLPDGLRSRVAEGGLNLSLGQRQRIVLARALLGSPRVLLLDEPETGLDPAAQAVLDRALREYQNTVLMVTHDIDRARQADEVWRIVNGQLADCGPPSKLLGDRETTVDLLAWSRTAAKRHPDNKGVSHGS
ncbi:MAG TPA: ABC transporter ATP-binding protein, partial [Chromatiales bacterium]|nr:ABC transporter ATP-binding protein [Chromatiales bacterium]